MNEEKIKKDALYLHKRLKGKIKIESKIEVSPENLSLLYTPGVAYPCEEILQNPELSYTYTSRGNMVGIISDGSAVLGLGDIGPLAAMPVMEGKAILMKEFAGIDAFPLILKTKNVDEIVKIIEMISPTFGAINLEDISAPRCFEIESKLIENNLDIPVFHDDQHGTAVVVLAGIINSLKLVGKNKEEVKVVICGAGAAGIAVAKMLLFFGIKNILVCDRKGIIYEGREDGMNFAKEEIAKLTNPQKEKGDLAQAIKNADIFIGLSTGNILTPEMVKTMAPHSIIFAMSNPIPEILPEVAYQAGAEIVATGRSDYPNQINNLLAFPGILRAVLDLKIKRITMEIKFAAAQAIADLVPKSKLCAKYFIPPAYNRRVPVHIVKSIAQTLNG